MAEIQYRTPVKQESSVTFSEFVAPLALLVAGLLLFGFGAFMQAGAGTAAQVMAIVFIVAAVQTVVGIGAAYLTAAMIGTSFGELRTAFVKLAGIIVFSSAIAFLIPFGGIVSLFVYFGLLLWLFELEMYEAVAFAFIFAIIRVGVMAMISGMLP